MDFRTRSLDLTSWLRPASGTERVAVRQMQELQKQVPLLYALLTVNAVAVSYTHYQFAPAWLTVGVLAILVPVCAVRGVHWLCADMGRLSRAQAVRELRRTTVLTAVLSVSFVVWALILDMYGGPFEQGHVASFIAITVIGCIFCLMHLPIAALMVTLIVNVAYLAYYLSSGNSVLMAIALNTAFVTFVMVRVLMTNFVGFIKLIESQEALSAKQAETQQLSEENARLAHMDSLTELPNRRSFFMRLDEMIESADDAKSDFALAIFDLDRFKPINDTYGHVVGDRVLAETGRRLAAFASDRVTVARLGGDEFGVLIRKSGTEQDLVVLGQSICDALRQPVQAGEAQLIPGCSGGMSIYPDAGRTAAALFERSDYALYHSKEKARGTVTLFSQEHEDAIGKERAVETALQIADLDAEMQIHFQPILDTSDDRIVMVEALARWTNPLLGHVPPDRFIAAAERCGMIHTLTLLLFKKALADLHRLPPEIGLSFNLSSHDLTSSETVIALMAAVRRSEIEPARITMELTETALLRDFDMASRAIEALRALGMKIALDDFGTGYSSLGYVHRLPLDKIKIDRSFMADIGERSGLSIVTTVLDLCQNLQLDCIAEGVETREQLDLLRRFGCRFVQGYLIGRPVPVEAMAARLRAEERRDALTA